MFTNGITSCQQINITEKAKYMIIGSRQRLGAIMRSPNIIIEDEMSNE